MGRGPLDISGYEAVDGYQSIQVVAKGLSPQGTLELVKASGLKGRGGAGFPTGLKWASALRAP